MKFFHAILLVFMVASVAACGDDGHKKAKAVSHNDPKPTTDATYATLTVALSNQKLWAQGAQMTFHVKCIEASTKKVFPDQTYPDMTTNVPFALLASHCVIDGSGLKIAGVSYNLANPFELDLKLGDNYTVYMVVIDGVLAMVSNFTLSTTDWDGDCITGAADTDPTNRLIPNPSPPAACQ